MQSNLNNSILFSMKRKSPSVQCASAAKTGILRESVGIHCVWLLILAGVLFVSASSAFGQGASSANDPALQIDVFTMLEKGNVVIDLGHAVYTGDMPFALGDIHLLATDFRDWNTKGQVVVVFHGDAGYLVLNDESYNVNRHVATGNPYKNLLNGLMALGVQLELCGATAKGNHWGNANLLPGIKVNLNAMVRVTQLEQEGYTMIYE